MDFRRIELWIPLQSFQIFTSTLPTISWLIDQEVGLIGLARAQRFGTSLVRYIPLFCVWEVEVESTMDFLWLWGKACGHYDRVFYVPIKTHQRKQEVDYQSFQPWCSTFPQSNWTSGNQRHAPKTWAMSKIVKHFRYPILCQTTLIYRYHIRISMLCHTESLLNK